MYSLTNGLKRPAAMCHLVHFVVQHIHFNNSWPRHYICVCRNTFQSQIHSSSDLDLQGYKIELIQSSHPLDLELSCWAALSDAGRKDDLLLGKSWNNNLFSFESNPSFDSLIKDCARCWCSNSRYSQSSYSEKIIQSSDSSHGFNLYLAILSH